MTVPSSLLRGSSAQAPQLGPSVALRPGYAPPLLVPFPFDSPSLSLSLSPIVPASPSLPLVLFLQSLVVTAHDCGLAWLSASLFEFALLRGIHHSSKKQFELHIHLLPITSGPTPLGKVPRNLICAGHVDANVELVCTTFVQKLKLVQESLQHVTVNLVVTSM